MTNIRKHFFFLNQTKYHIFCLMTNFRRGCFFDAERYLKYFQIYTESNCWLECLTNRTLFLCQCVFYYMPRMIATPVCGHGQQECLKNVFKAVVSGNNPIPSMHCNCLPTCTSINYRFNVATTIEDVSYVSEYLNKTFDEMNGNVSEM